MLKDFLRILAENFPTELKNIPTFSIENKNSNNRKNAPYTRFLEHDSKLVKNDDV